MISMRHLAALALVATGTLTLANTARAAEIGVGFGGYALTDFDPAMATTLAIASPDFKFGGTFSLRSGEGTTNLGLGAKALIVVDTKGSTDLGVGGSFFLVTDAIGNGTGGTDPFIGFGFGGGLEKRLGDGVSISGDLWPLSLRINGGTRVGFLSSGSINLNYYFGGN
ncbi:MAG: hypothetical protein KC591_14260 [Gemmatimonadetes bacterium]|nr:hypothetical protein [Gemmatimonadota bacterium]